MNDPDMILPDGTIVEIKTKTYVTEPSENFAVREEQMAVYHPDLCYRVGQQHCAYGWSKRYNGDWDDDQWAAYVRGYDQYAQSKQEAGSSDD